MFREGMPPVLDPEYAAGKGEKNMEPNIEVVGSKEAAIETDIGSLQVGLITPEQFIDNVLARGSGSEDVNLTPKRREGAITAIKFWVKKLENQESGMTAEYFHDNVYRAAVKALTEPAAMTEKELERKAREDERMKAIRERRAA